jgi:hypothetical protein
MTGLWLGDGKGTGSFEISAVFPRMSRDSSGGVATGYRPDDEGAGVRVPVGGKNFHFSMSSRAAVVPTQPPIHCVPGALSPGIKRPGREADHSPPTTAEVKKTWVCTSTPLYVFMA